MGFENFNVMLEGGETATQDALDVIEGLQGVTRDGESEWTPESRCYLYRDGQHAIELEVLGSPERVSCRFTLCHPASVDVVFVDFVRKLMKSLRMQVQICDDDLTAAFSLDRFDEFSHAVVRCINARRQEWKRAFGDQELGATTNEAHRHIILPHCQPVVEKAG